MLELVFRVFFGLEEQTVLSLHIVLSQIFIKVAFKYAGILAMSIRLKYIDDIS